MWEFRNCLEEYTGNEEIEFFPNEHFIDQQDSADKEKLSELEGEYQIIPERLDEIAEYSGLSGTDVKQLAKSQTK